MLKSEIQESPFNLPLLFTIHHFPRVCEKTLKHPLNIQPLLYPHHHGPTLGPCHPFPLPIPSLHLPTWPPSLLSCSPTWHSPHWSGNALPQTQTWPCHLSLPSTLLTMPQPLTPSPLQRAFPAFLLWVSSISLRTLCTLFRQPFSTARAAFQGSVYLADCPHKMVNSL